MSGNWPNGAHAAVALTIDNMGEAADINRKLWPESEKIGNHFSVKKVIPQLLRLLQKYDISATYFIETWNLGVYGDIINDDIAAAGHEVGWHAWQHEAWSKLKDANEESDNFKRSFVGDAGIEEFMKSKDHDSMERYRGFRPPGGIINGETTLNLCKQYELQYISPAGESAALIKADESDLVVLPFKWATVDAYYYMETFSGLRKMKGENSTEPLSEQVLEQRYIGEIEKAIEKGGYVSLLFHPFLTTSPERVDTFERVLQYLVRKRDEGQIWLARCRDVNDWIRKHPDIVGSDPEWDLSQWR